MPGRLEPVDGVVRMPEQTWPEAAASKFLGMWVVMMIAIKCRPWSPMLQRLPAGRG